MPLIFDRSPLSAFFSCLLVTLLCTPATVSQAQTSLIHNVDILSMGTDTPEMISGHAVLVVDGVIEDIGPLAGIDVPSDAILIDGMGGTLMPGLVDMHVHVWDAPELLAYLSYGITTVRNMSGMPYLLTWQAEIESGERRGPRLLTTGPILNSPGPNAQLNHQLVSTADEAVRAVEWQYAMGFRELKVYSNLTRETYGAILGAANRLGMSISGHTPEGTREYGMPEERDFNIRFSEILDDGFITIEHMESIVWHGLRDQLDDEALQALASEVAAVGVAVDATLLAHHNLVRAANEKQDFVNRQGVELLNPLLLEFEQENIEFWTKMPRGTREDYDAFYARATAAFQQAGVPLVAGTDAGIFLNVPGLSLIEELQLMTGGGMTPYQALLTATRTPAKVLSLHNLGQIELGYQAELVLLAGNPLDDLGILTQPVGVMRQGEWLSSDAVQAMRIEATQHDTARTEALVFSALEEQQAAVTP